MAVATRLVYRSYGTVRQGGTFALRMAPPTYASLNFPHQPSAVLVVEDDVLVRLGTAEFLRSAGLVVLEAGNAADAITILLADERVALVFSDVQMPGALNGADLACWIGHERPRIQVILTSGVYRHAGEPNALWGTPFVAKPYDLTELVRLIRAALQR